MFQTACRSVSEKAFACRQLIAVITACLLSGVAFYVSAQTENQPSIDETVVYPASFFIDYQPISALDMVEQIPGFQIDDGDSTRGFGGAAGNVLINGERPGSKQDSVSSILSRIPAERVERIELIRGQTGALDARGQAVVANVLLLDNDQRDWVWDLSVEQDLDSGGPTPSGSISMVDRIGGTRLAAGLSFSTGYAGNKADEQVFDGAGLIEIRNEFERFRDQAVSINLNTASEIDSALLEFNIELGYEPGDFVERSRRQPIDPMLEPVLIRQSNDTDEIEYEFGSTLRWPINADLSARTLVLVTGETNDRDSELRRITESLNRLDQRAERERDELEAIGRFELSYSGWRDHTVELEFETAYNRLDNELALFADSGDGLVRVDVPGANTRVEELRADLLLSDSWQLRDWTIESGLGAELSRIEQSGQNAAQENQQDFFFLKPSLTLTWSPTANHQTRLELAREVGQLDFGDFVSSANFDDDELDLGNPELKPQNTWVSQLTHELRFGEIGVASLSIFHNWVRDVQDLLPIGGIFEVPGNIGNGRSWGIELESTLPLDRMGLRNGRLDLEADWLDSRVTDPVTGQARRFSGQRGYSLFGELRQDLVAQRWAWGVEADYVDESRNFGLDEIEIDDRGLDLELFIETTRFWGVKMQLNAVNVLDREFLRDRRLFDGPRGDDANLSLRELRDRRRGRTLVFSVSGTF